MVKSPLANTKTSTGTGNWNTGATWSPSGVPSSSDTVIIRSGDSITLDVNLTCQYLVFLAGGEATLLYCNAADLTVTGGIVMNGTTQTSGNYPTEIIVSSGNFYCGSIAINIDNANAGSSTNYTQIYLKNSSNLTVSGDITLNTAITGSGTTGLKVETGNYSDIKVGGSFMSTKGYFFPAYSTVEYTGTNQTVSAYPYYYLILPGGNTLDGNIIIPSGGELTLNGIVTTDASHLVTINSGASITGATNTKYVNGPLRIIGKANFVFSVGKGGKWAQCTINNSPSVSTNASTTDTFTVEYFNTYYSDTSVSGSGISNVSKKEYWSIARTGTSTPTVTLYYEDSTFSGITNPYIDTSNLFLARYNGTDWVTASGGTKGVTVNTINGTVSLTNVSAFGLFTFGSNNREQSLPVKLIKFDAEVISGKVVLNWTTATEINNDRFEIERSINGIDFEKIGMVKGSGTCNQILQYKFIDNQLIKYKTFYRLKQVDYNGEFEYSVIKKVDYESIVSSKLIVYPNPTTGLVIVTGGEEETIFQFCNFYGQIIKESDQKNIDLSGYCPGIYFIRIKDDRGSTPTVKILIK
ncbi:T9SS type A sorting domain-containing protein [Candidatus Nomurabacteria bacterium]|nr:T9SS type A sorting domain-containing protein [Candidatus Nomurabacteria bacterium]